MRLAIALTVLGLSGVGLSLAGPAAASIRKPIDIPAESLESALKALARTDDLLVIFVSEDVAKFRTAGIAGSLTPEEALTRLLQGTGLTYRYLDTKTVTVIPLDTTPPRSGARAKTADSPQADDSDPPLRLAQEQQVSGSGAASAGTAVTLEEIVVTAQKREERLKDVPVPVTAISGATLIDRDQVRIQDFYSSVPGLSVTPAVESVQRLTIRGITTGGTTNPTVGVTIDDVPFGASTELGGGSVVPDIDPGDLARVEVLRGPQGALYGASSMGGLFKFVTVDPSTDQLSGRIQAGTSAVYSGAEAGYSVRASVNVPLTDTLAVRVSGFSRQDPGYIDNPVLHIDGINKAQADGGRLSALWRPSGIVSLKVAALFQSTRADGSSDVDVLPGLGNLQQSYPLGVGGYDRKVEAYSATLKVKVGSVDLTAISGYNVNTSNDSWDYTYALGGIVQNGVPGSGFNGFGVPAAPVIENNRTNKFSQEVRLEAPLGSRLDWLLGAFYTHETSQYVENVMAEAPATGAIAGQFAGLSFPTTYEEYAAFTDLTVHVTDRFDIQVGGRESQIRQTATEVDSGPYAPLFDGGASPFVTPEVSTKADAFTYLATPRFRISPDLMVYARLASGYRPGGANLTADVPRQYDPDKTQNYEIGTKADFLDHVVSVDASLYYIDWKDIQLSLRNPINHLGYTGNASEAKSQGLELSVELRPLTGLTVSAWSAWNDAVLTEAIPAGSPAVGATGDRLPDSSRFSANLSAEQDFPLFAKVTGFVGGEVSYVGSREGIFVGAAQSRQAFPAYAKTDLRAGTKYDDWTFNLFVNNVTDRRGLLEGGAEYNPPYAYVYIQPRTVGLSVARKF